MNKLSVAIKLKPIASYPNKTWGAEVSGIIINDLPQVKQIQDAFDQDRMKELLENTSIFLIIEKGTATLLLANKQSLKGKNMRDRMLEILGSEELTDIELAKKMGMDIREVNSVIYTLMEEDLIEQDFKTCKWHLKNQQS